MVSAAEEAELMTVCLVSCTLLEVVVEPVCEPILESVLFRPLLSPVCVSPLNGLLEVFGRPLVVAEESRPLSSVLEVVKLGSISIGLTGAKLRSVARGSLEWVIGKSDIMWEADLKLRKVWFCVVV